MWSLNVISAEAYGIECKWKMSHNRSQNFETSDMAKTE